MTNVDTSFLERRITEVSDDFIQEAFRQRAMAVGGGVLGVEVDKPTLTDEQFDIVAKESNRRLTDNLLRIVLSGDGL